MKNVLLKRHIKVPIFEVEVWLYVARDAVLAHKRCRTFDQKNYGEWRALCTWEPGSGIFGLFFQSDLTTNEVAHEIKHLVDGVMKHVDASRCDEPKAYLTGYLTERIHQKFKAAGIKVR